MILYTVENTDEQWNGRPVWEFVFGVGEPYYLYVIDDRTGELLAVTGTDGQPTEPPAAQEAEKGDRRRRPPPSSRRSTAGMPLGPSA